MQRMAEFMEQRLGIVPADQNRFSGFPFYKIRIVRNDRRHLLQVLLRSIFAHPRAGLFPLPRVRIEIPQANVFAVCIFDFPYPDVGSDSRDSVNFVELKTIELSGNPEDRLANLIELKVWFHFIHIDIVFCFADFFRVIPVIPWLDFDSCSFFIRNRLHVDDFLVHAFDSGGPNLHH